MSNLGELIECEECRMKLGLTPLYGKVGQFLRDYLGDASSPASQEHKTLQQIHHGVHDLMDEQALAMGYFVEQLHNFLLGGNSFDANVLTIRIAESMFQPKPVMAVITGFETVLRSMNKLPKK